MSPFCVMLALITALPATPQPQTRIAIFAVGDYDDARLRLPSVLTDAHRVLRTSLENGVRVEHLGGCWDTFAGPGPTTAAEIQAELKRFLSGVPARDRVVVYWSGHAFRDESGELYWAARDWSPGGGNAIRVRDVVSELKNCPAKNKLLVLDCCYAGAALDICKASQIPLLASCRADEKSLAGTHGPGSAWTAKWLRRFGK